MRTDDIARILKIREEIKQLKEELVTLEERAIDKRLKKVAIIIESNNKEIIQLYKEEGFDVSDPFCCIKSGYLYPLSFGLEGNNYLTGSNSPPSHFPKVSFSYIKNLVLERNDK